MIQDSKPNMTRIGSYTVPPLPANTVKTLNEINSALEAAFKVLPTVSAFRTGDLPSLFLKPVYDVRSLG